MMHHVEFSCADLARLAQREKSLASDTTTACTGERPCLRVKGLGTIARRWDMHACRACAQDACEECFARRAKRVAYSLNVCVA
eukprot:5437832-Heterocapsa_arctica.AAC.1